MRRRNWDHHMLCQRWTSPSRRAGRYLDAKRVEAPARTHDHPVKTYAVRSRHHVPEVCPRQIHSPHHFLGRTESA
eukprot:1811041-Rhodomonas_salina.1